MTNVNDIMQTVKAAQQSGFEKLALMISGLNKNDKNDVGMAPGGAASVAAANVAQRMADDNNATPVNNGSSPNEPGSARLFN
eukprot:1271783-Karenia_brevis.AAC.1